MAGRDGAGAGMGGRAGRDGAGAGPGWVRGRDGGRGRAGMGWGGGRACSYIKNVRRNRLECRFGAEYRGKNPVLFTGFFPRGTGYFPRFPGFFPREKSGEFEGKIRCYHWEGGRLRLAHHLHPGEAACGSGR